MSGRPLGILLLAVWLILYGAAILFKLHFDSMDIIMALLAIAAGILLLIGR